MAYRRSSGDACENPIHATLLVRLLLAMVIFYRRKPFMSKQHVDRAQRHVNDL